MKGKARATRRTLNKVDPVSDKKPVGFESVQTDLGASTSRTQRKGSGRPSAPVPTNEAATSAVARTGVASRSSSAPVPTNEVVASVVVQTDISDADQTASTSRSLFGLHLPKDLVFTKKGKSLPQPRFSISWTPGQNVLEHSTDRWSIFRDGLEENSLISDTRISSIEEALKKSFPGKYKDGINLIYVELSADFKPLNQDPFPNHQWSDLYRFPGIHPQAIAANLHATNTQWPRLNDESTPSHLLIYPFAPSWDFTHFPVLYDRSRPWRSYSPVVRTDPWNENISWYEDYKILEPEWLIQREKIASRLKQCVLMFKTVSNIADFVSLSLPKPDECKFDVLKDWDRLLDRRREPEMQRAIKLLFMRALDLRAWALWALFKVIDFLASLHELPPPHFPITGEIIGCTLFSSSPGANPELEFGEYLEPLVRHGIPFFVIEEAPLPPPARRLGALKSLCVAYDHTVHRPSTSSYFRIPANNVFRPNPWIRGVMRLSEHPLFELSARISELLAKHRDNNKEFRIDIFGVIHSIYPQTFDSFQLPESPLQLPESLPEEEGSPPPGPVVREPCRDLLEFGQRYQKAPDPPMFDDTEEGLAKFEATHERYDREEREAQHHPYGALLIARAYLGIGEAQREVGNIIAGMAGKNVRSTTWGSKRQTPLERYCMRKWANPVKLDKTEFSRRQQLSREYLQLIGEFTEPQANPIPVTANEDTGVAGSLQAKTRGPVKEFVEPPTHSAAAAASGIMGLAGPLQTRMHDPVSQTHGGEQSAPLHMSGASGSGSMELDEGRREVGSRTTQHSASRVETRSYRCPSGPIGRRWDAQKHLSDALNRRPARGRVLARDRETYHDHPRHWQPPHDKREDRRGDYHRRSMMSRSRSPVRHRRNSSSPPSLRRHRSPFSFPFSRRRHHSHSSSRSCRRSHSPHSRSHSRSRSPDRSRSRSRPRSYSVSRCLQSSHRRSRSASCPPSPLGPSRRVASPIEMQVDVPSSNPRPLPQPGCHLSQQVPVLRMIQPHSIPFTSWHCLTTPLEDKHFQAFGKADLDVWAAPLFEVRGVYAVAQAKASKSALKYGKTRIAILAKHRDVLDRVAQLISENNAHYHALLAFAIFSPLDPFSGKEAASYSWVSKVDLHFVGCVWESVPFEELRSRLLTDAPLVLTNDNVGEELLYHGFDPLVSTEAQAAPRNVKLHSFDFSPHVLDAWYDTMPLQFKSYGVTRFMFVARAYDSALFKGRKAFMAEIWQTESVIDAALRNLLEYLCENSQDVICRESKEKTESFQYLRGQRKWRLTVDTAIKDYCPYFKVK
ncbi:uncharacterized protein EI90DRAFT_3140411 [Cantharellus anzutake]|uniref:uncharacterized protein n=1 Tax=Cantharellus anzutake TaxID=1750568 RepID=UPI00190319B0|nr:uncharacterized protein EI90DRAFT_3140411 [Cantharellus anzutake]KAF8309706.1 hypothetical protein EI90DRAFT_3140411 [Cantharellus anzutake]